MIVSVLYVCCGYAFPVPSVPWISHGFPTQPPPSTCSNFATLWRKVYFLCFFCFFLYSRSFLLHSSLFHGPEKRVERRKIISTTSINAATTKNAISNISIFHPPETNFSNQKSNQISI